MEEPLTRIRHHLNDTAHAIIAELDAIDDPVTRQAVARVALEELLPALGQEVKAHRSRTVASLKEERTLKDVAALLNTSAARVAQIIKEGQR
jgi:DNA-directed RNA polymerase specialized sigma subunit